VGQWIDHKKTVIAILTDKGREIKQTGRILKEMPSLPAAEFLRFLLSRDGQQIVAASGNIPLDAATVK
jgi:ABC-type thiamine transport system substrate-binding protein